MSFYAKYLPASAGGGTVTSITAGTGLTGGTITSSGTIALDQSHLTLNGSTSGSFTQRAADVTVDYTVKWPAAQGAASTVLINDGAGNLSWIGGSGTGDVVGPSSATDNAIARFDSTTGKLIQNSIPTIDDAGILSATAYKISNDGSFQIDNTQITTEFGFRLEFQNGTASALEIVGNNTTQAFRSMFEIQSNKASNIGMIISPYAAMTVDNFQIRDNTDTVLTGFDKGANYFSTTLASTPSNPSAGYKKLYFKNDGNLYMLNSSGVETQVNGGGGATTALDNLASTAVNADIKTADASQSLGGGTSSATSFFNLYLNGGIKDDDGVSVFDVATRTLKDSSGTTAIDVSSSTQILVSSSIIPDAALAYDLGASGAEWTNLYVNNIYASGNCGSLIFDVENGIFSDGSGVNALNFFNRTLIDTIGNPVLDWGTNSDTIEIKASVFKVPTTTTPGGTTGDQTINKMSGTVNFAAAASTLTVTNSKVLSTSLVFAVVRTNDSTATIKNVVPSNGSFVITLSAAATAETSVGFFVVNG